MSRTLRCPGAGLVSDAGIAVLLEESHALPLVDFEVAFRTGSYADPDDKEGLARLVARMVRMGTRKLTGAEVEERIAHLGAKLSIEVSGGATRFQGTVIRRNLEPFVALIGELITAPALRTADLAHVKRETISDLVGVRDHDEALAARGFRRTLFGDHPFGRSIAGTTSSVRRVTRADVVAHHARNYRRGDVVVGAAGDVTLDELVRLVDRHLGAIPRGTSAKPSIPAPRIAKGRRICIVDKPERTQTQLFVGTLGIGFADPLSFPFHVGNVGFGGMFTGRLMHEVRSVRGLSYGASSAIDLQRKVFSIHTFPSSTDAVACTALVLDLLEGFVQKGPTDAEVRAAKSFLVRGHCFAVDTAAKRLDARMDIELYALPPEHYVHYERLVRKVKPAEVRTAVRKRISSRDLAVSIVASERDVRAGLEALPGVSEIAVVPYDRG